MFTRERDATIEYNPAGRLKGLPNSTIGSRRHCVQERDSTVWAKNRTTIWPSDLGCGHAALP